jgi:ribosomal 50S subunit-recycling heat shock protein
MTDSEYPMRINKYLAHQKYCTRRAADELVHKGKVTINGRPAKLGDKVQAGDKVEVFFKPKKYRYYAASTKTATDSSSLRMTAVSPIPF